jgi:hypothetical protein
VAFFSGQSKIDSILVRPSLAALAVVAALAAN